MGFGITITGYENKTLSEYLENNSSKEGFRILIERIREKTEQQPSSRASSPEIQFIDNRLSI